MIEKQIQLPDVHLTNKNDKVYDVVKKFIKKFKPDKIFIMGDFMDVSALSAWDYDKKRKMEGRRFKQEVEKANEELDFLQKHSKQVIYLEGNHEYRIERYLDKNPEMEGLIEVENVLNLKDRNIPFIPQKQQPYIDNNLAHLHGVYTNKYHATKTLQAYGTNVIYGHTHRPQSDMMSMMFQKPIMSWCLGCLCDKHPDYMNGRPTSHLQNFGIRYVDTKTKNFNQYSVNIINNKFIWEGKVYE